MGLSNLGLWRAKQGLEKSSHVLIGSWKEPNFFFQMALTTSARGFPAKSLPIPATAQTKERFRTQISYGQTKVLNVRTRGSISSPVGSSRIRVNSTCPTRRVTFFFVFHQLSLPSSSSIISSTSTNLTQIVKYNPNLIIHSSPPTLTPN